MNVEYIRQSAFEDELQKIAETSWKTFVGNLWDKTKVYLVNGEYVRDELKFAEFIGGGHGYWDKRIPKDEIWIEKEMAGAIDNGSMGVHEIIEYTLMKYKNMSYDEAHKIANSVETIIRELLNKKD